MKKIDNFDLIHRLKNLEDRDEVFYSQLEEFPNQGNALRQMYYDKGQIDILKQILNK